MSQSIYQQYGYEDREDYLINLAHDHDVDYQTVKTMADLLGEDEDFDGLITSIEDI